MRYHLEAKDNYIACKPAPLAFTLENLTNGNLCVLKWNTPLEGIKNWIFEISCDGKKILYGGRMMKRLHAGRDDYAHLGPYGKISSVVDLSEVYELPNADQCQVEFHGTILDVARDEALVPRPAEQWQALFIKRNTVIFSVTGNCKGGGTR